MGTEQAFCDGVPCESGDYGHHGRERCVICGRPREADDDGD